LLLTFTLFKRHFQETNRITALKNPLLNNIIRSSLNRASPSHRLGKGGETVLSSTHTIMKNKKELFKIILWFIFFVTFSAEFAKIVFELNPDYGHKSLKAANAFFWSSLLLIELVMGGLVIYYMVTHPPRRLRLFVLSLCHFSVIMVLPMVFDDWSWTCLLYPWPHSLQAFDPATPAIALFISLLVGFIIVPVITVKWGGKRILWIHLPPWCILFRDLRTGFSFPPYPFEQDSRHSPPDILYHHGLLPCNHPGYTTFHCSPAYHTKTCLFFHSGVFLLRNRCPPTWWKELL